MCYCIPQCLSGAAGPGPCCSDFPQVCPAEYAAGKNTIAPALVMPPLPPGCAAPDSSVIPVPTNKINFEDAGRSCANQCGSQLVDSKGSAVCYCDSSCLLTADCCPDFQDSCPVDPCIVAMITPAQTPPAGSCRNACNLLVQIDQFNVCSCEVTCVQAGTCCQDFLQVCEVPEDDYPVVTATSCYQKCGANAGKCWCDYACLANGDCCSDFTKACGTSATFPSQTKAGLGSCLGKCNSAGIDCWCDSKCLSVGDCCWDYLKECQKA